MKYNLVSAARGPIRMLKQGQNAFSEADEKPDCRTESIITLSNYHIITFASSLPQIITLHKFLP